jgi:hypothetical protein
MTPFLSADTNKLIETETSTSHSAARLAAMVQLRHLINEAFTRAKTIPSTDVEALPTMRRTLERAKKIAEKKKTADANATVAVLSEYVDSVELVDLHEIDTVTNEVVDEVLERRVGDYYDYDDGPFWVRGQHALEVLRKVMKRFDGRPVLKEDVLRCHKEIMTARYEWDRDVNLFVSDEWPRYLPPPW